MIQRRELLSIILAAIVFFVIYLPLHWGYITMSDIGSLTSALLIAGSILIWGLRERIDPWAKGAIKPLTAAIIVIALVLVISLIFFIGPKPNQTSKEDVLDRVQGAPTIIISDNALNITHFMDDETFNGTAKTETLTLAHVPNPTNSLQLFRNGQRLRMGSENDYTLSGNKITLLFDSSWDQFDASYRY
jgi:multisubunit Na+/H+ antiporter MnhB subunit